MWLSHICATLVTLALTSGCLASLGPQTDLYIENAYISPDGFRRSAVLVDRVFPGPLIAANKGDNFGINVHNRLTDTSMPTSTSIHWHGLYQEGTSWADGTAYVSQCPLLAGNSFTYSYSVPDQAGTFWYHSHVQAQYCDGLRGPLVIYDPNDPYSHLYDVDDDSTVITLSDWYHTVSTQAGAFPAPDSVLINGQGRWSQNATADLAVISVQKGTRYRFRLVSLSCDPNFTFSIDGHTMTVIEVDGVNHESLTVDSIQILAGQRYSFILDANQPVGNFWIRALPSSGPPANFDGGINSAILRYSGAASSEPTSSQTTSVKPLEEVNLQPLDNPAAPGSPEPGGADVVLNFPVVFDGTKYLVNGEPYSSPTVPVLLQILSGNYKAQELMPAGSVYTLPPNKVIEMSFPLDSSMTADAPHPLHLHGHTFSVVRSAGTTTYDYKNPVRRDVVSLGGADPSQPDNVTIRFTTDNPGPWFLHCHIDWHLQAGFAAVLAEDAPGIYNSLTSLPSAWENLCRNN